MSRIASGLVRLSRSLLPRTSRFQASKRAPRNSSSSSLSAWIIVPMAPSSTRMRSRASSRSCVSMEEILLRSDIAAESVSLLPLPGGETAGVRGARSKCDARRPRQRWHDILKHSVEVFHHIVVPVSEHQIATRLEDGGAFGVGFFIRRVMSTIELDDQTGIRATEVGDVAIDRHLSPELQA